MKSILDAHTVLRFDLERGDGVTVKPVRGVETDLNLKLCVGARLSKADLEIEKQHLRYKLKEQLCSMIADHVPIEYRFQPIELGCVHIEAFCDANLRIGLSYRGLSPVQHYEKIADDCIREIFANARNIPKDLRDAIALAIMEYLKRHGVGDTNYACDMLSMFIDGARPGDTVHEAVIRHTLLGRS